jgi:hypothetical protein
LEAAWRAVVRGWRGLCWQRWWCQTYRDRAAHNQDKGAHTHGQTDKGGQRIVWMGTPARIEEAGWAVIGGRWSSPTPGAGLSSPLLPLCPAWRLPRPRVPEWAPGTARHVPLGTCALEYVRPPTVPSWPRSHPRRAPDSASQEMMVPRMISPTNGRNITIRNSTAMCCAGLPWCSRGSPMESMSYNAMQRPSSRITFAEAVRLSRRVSGELGTCGRGAARAVGLRAVHLVHVFLVDHVGDRVQHRLVELGRHQLQRVLDNSQLEHAGRSCRESPGREEFRNPSIRLSACANAGMSADTHRLKIAVHSAIG